MFKSFIRATALSLITATSTGAEEKTAFPVYGKVGGCSVDNHHVVLNLHSSYLTAAVDKVTQITVESIVTADFLFEKTIANMTAKDIDNGALVDSDFINATLPKLRNTLEKQLRKTDPNLEIGLLLSLRGAEYRYDRSKCP